MNINLLYILLFDKLLHRGITWFYGDISNVVLPAPLWTDLFRGRIEGWILYSRRGCYGWRFNHDGWVKWRCHDIATWLTQANTSVGYKNDISLFYDTYKYYVCSMFFIYIYIYIYMSVFEKILVDSCFVLARRAWEGRPTREKCFGKEL